MTPLSPHFTLEEMLASQEAARNGIDNTPSPTIIQHLKEICTRAEAVRALLGHPMLVSSGYRSPALNSAIGGAIGSAHCDGDAMDFICPAFGSPITICRAIFQSAIEFDQLIEEGTWVHISFAATMRRQVLTKAPGGGYATGLRGPMKLGRQAPIPDARTLKLADYLGADALPVVPSTYNWGQAVPADGWGMMLNDSLGDCTAAAVGHILLAHTSNRGTPVRLSDADILGLYEATSGYNPNDPSTDRGAVERQVLNYWRNTGVAGHRIAAYVALDVKNVSQLREAIYLFGAIYTGVMLPTSAQDQDPWYVTDQTLAGDAAPDSWGGHAVPIIGYDSRAFACVTWGAMKWMTEDWWLAYGEEAYALISVDWAPPDGSAPNRFNLDQLKADLNLL